MVTKKKTAEVFEIVGDEDLEAKSCKSDSFSSDSEEEDNESIDNFEWLEQEHIPEPLLFQPSQVGFLPSEIGAATDLSPFKCLNIFVDKQMIWKIANKTNLYQQQQEEKKPVGVEKKTKNGSRQK